MLARELFAVFFLSVALGLQTPGLNTRRDVLAAAAAAASPWLMPHSALAASPPAAPAVTPEGTLWLTGKSDPLRPTSKDKPDGTKRDNKYLSCLNDCVPRCQGPPGPNQKVRMPKPCSALARAGRGMRVGWAWAGCVAGSRSLDALLSCFRAWRICLPVVHRSAPIALTSARKSAASHTSNAHTKFAPTEAGRFCAGPRRVRRTLLTRQSACSQLAMVASCLLHGMDRCESLHFPFLFAAFVPYFAAYAMRACCFRSLFCSLCHACMPAEVSRKVSPPFEDLCNVMYGLVVAIRTPLVSETRRRNARQTAS